MTNVTHGFSIIPQKSEIKNAIEGEGLIFRDRIISHWFVSLYKTTVQV